MLDAESTAQLYRVLNYRILSSFRIFFAKGCMTPGYNVVR
jgi:hypothetical protein